MLLKRLALTGAAMILLVACEQRTLPPMPLQGAQWATCTDEGLGIRFQYPEALKPVDVGSAGMFLRYQGRVNVRVIWTDEENARSHGLWAGRAPDGEASLAGIPAQRYLYAHWDGPSYVLTQSYVIPYRGKLLGVEFRPGGIPEEGRRRMLDSFEILQKAAK